MPTRAPTPSLPDVFIGSLLVAQGGVTRAQLRDRSLAVPVLHGVYRRRSAPETHAVRCRAAALVTPRARLTGPSMATLLGVPLARTDDDVTMVVREGRPPRRAGIDVREVSAGSIEGQVRAEIPLTHLARMAFDLATHATLETGVAHLDAVVRAGMVRLIDVERWLEGRHDHGVRQAREAVGLCDARAESPPESICRVRLTRAGLVVVPQVEVFDERGFVARLDLAVEGTTVAVEYDGLWHGQAQQVVRDRARLNRLREAGWVVVHVTAATLARPGALEAAVWRAVLAQRHP